MRTVKLPTRRNRTTVDQLPAFGVNECDLSIVSGTVGFLIRTCQVQTFRSFYRAFRDTGLTPASYAALAIIGANPGVRQGFLANVLVFREPNMTTLVKELSAAGLVTRRPRSADKRALGL